MKIRDFALERYFARWEFRAPHLLCASDLEPWTLPELLAVADEESRERFGALRLGYTESAGDPSLRGAIAGLYETLEADDVLVFTGAQEGIFVFMATALEPGDHAVVLAPCYQSLHEVARSFGVEVTLVPLRAAEGWKVEAAAVEAALTPRTCALVVNYPHSPTGALIDRAGFERLVQLADGVGIRFFSDEVYRYLELDPAERLPAAADLSPRAASLGVLSKSFGLAGLRLGWIASRDRDLLARLAAFKDYTTICTAAPSEALALLALRAREAVVERARAILAANLPYLDRFFAERADVFSWVRPRGGTVAFPRLEADLPVERFCDELIRGEGVLLLPGTVFDDPDNRFRIGYGRRDLPEVLPRLERFCRVRFG